MRIVIKNCRNCAKPHDFEFDRPFLKEARFIDRTYGMSALDFENALNADDGSHESMEGLAALLDILHRREGIVIPQLEIDLDPADLEVIPTEEEAQLIAAVEQGAADGEGKEEGAAEPPPT